MTNGHMKKSEVGEVRPSQTITTYGIGSLVDLPNMSVIVRHDGRRRMSTPALLHRQRLLFIGSTRFASFC
ncbi:MAG: hypothetical protein ACOVLE_14775 [Pirellula staleyi]